MGLIYVNPEGPQGKPDPLASAHDIKVTFSRMGMNSEETVALIAGGHTFGKTHGGGDPSLVGPEPEGCPVHAGGLGWKNEFGKGKAEDTITSGLEGPWTTNPTQWDNGYFDLLFKLRVGAHREPRRRQAVEGQGPRRRRTSSPDAHVPGKKVPTMMATTDLALIADPEFRAISERFHADPEYFADQYARAWFKLLHRDMGPKSRYLGPDVPAEELLWQDPVPAVDHELLGESDVAELKRADPRLRPDGVAARAHRLVGRRVLPRHRQARRRERRPAAPRAAGLLGGQRRHAGRHRQARRGPAGVRQAGLARRHDRARRLRRRREGRRRRGRRQSPCRSRRAAPTPRRSRPTSTA